MLRRGTKHIIYDTAPPVCLNCDLQVRYLYIGYYHCLQDSEFAMFTFICQKIRSGNLETAFIKLNFQGAIKNAVTLTATENKFVDFKDFRDLNARCRQFSIFVLVNMAL